ncbi:MAG TPA: hypothetical protein VIL46_14225 [Gemmataceae bacterium]
MLRVFARSPRQEKIRASRRVLLRVERMEERITPDFGTGPGEIEFDLQPPVLSLNPVEYEHQRWVRFTGTVADQSPATVVVIFDGVVTGTTHPDAEGNFDITLQASSLGQVNVQARDENQNYSQSVPVTLTSNRPRIENFVFIEGSANFGAFRGTVVDEDPLGLEVTFQSTGVTSIDGQSVAVDVPDGSFEKVVQLLAPPGDMGEVYAKVTDWWGLESDVVVEIVRA